MDLIVKVGDTLLLEGAMEDIQRLAADMDMVMYRHLQPAHSGVARPIPSLHCGYRWLLAPLNIAPILLLAVLAVALVCHS